MSRLGGRSFRSAGSSLECVEWLRQEKGRALRRAVQVMHASDRPVLCSAVLWVGCKPDRQRQCRVVGAMVGGLAGRPIRPAPVANPPTPCSAALHIIPAWTGPVSLLELASLGAQTLRCPSASLRTSLRSHCRRTRPTTFNLEVSVMARRPMTTTTTIRGAEQQAVGEAQRIPSSRRWTRPPHNQRTPDRPLPTPSEPSMSLIHEPLGSKSHGYWYCASMSWCHRQKNINITNLDCLFAGFLDKCWHVSLISSLLDTQKQPLSH